MAGDTDSSKKQPVWFRESGVDVGDVRMRSMASSHVKASEPTFLERDLQPSGSCRAEPHRAFSTFRLLKQGLIVNKSSISTDSRLAFVWTRYTCQPNMASAAAMSKKRAAAAEVDLLSTKKQRLDDGKHCTSSFPLDTDSVLTTTKPTGCGILDHLSTMQRLP